MPVHEVFPTESEKRFSTTSIGEIRYLARAQSRQPRRNDMPCKSVIEALAFSSLLPRYVGSGTASPRYGVRWPESWSQ